mgnify:FL=1
MSQNMIKNKNPFLSLCIPTRNQPKAVDRLLQSIVNQGGLNNIEVVISDGSDERSTEKIAKSYRRNFSVNYIRRLRSGIDAGIIDLVEASIGQYLWFVGDDETTENSIKTIESCPGVREGAGFIFANTINNKTGCAQVNCETNRFLEHDELLNLAGTGLAFISSNIMRADLAKESIAYARNYEDTDFVNFALTIDVISNSKQLYYLSYPVAIAHPNASEKAKRKVARDGFINNKFFEIFAVTWKNLLEDHSTVFSQKALKHAVRTAFGKAWRGVLVGWADGYDTPSGKRLILLRSYYRNPHAWAAFILFCMPAWVNKLMYISYRQVKRNLKKRVL